MFDLLFTDEPIVDYRSLQRADGALGKVFTSELIKRGVMKNSQKKMYISLIHSREDVLKALPKKRSART